MLRVPTVLCTPTRKPGQKPSDVESAAQRPDTSRRATASGARLLQGSVWHACDRRERGFRSGRYVAGPDPWIVHLRADPVGFCAVPEPTTLTGLAGTCVTGRP